MAQHRALQALRGTNDSLRVQVAWAESNREPAPADPPANAVSTLSLAEERELMQLRSKAGILQDQLRAASNHLAVLQRAFKSPPKTP
jgi:hypothetical protein